MRELCRGPAVLAVMFAVGCGPVGPLRFTFYPSVWATPLHQAAETANAAEVRQQLAGKPDVNARDAEGRTPLMLSAESGQRVTENLRLLIEAGADVNAADHKGMTALMYASRGWWRHAHGGLRPPDDVLTRMRMLIHAGADVHARTADGRTVLMVAASASGLYEGVPEACTVLIRAGAEVDARDPKGRTALMYAARTGPVNVAALLAAGADINAQDNEGLTPLMHVFGEPRHAGGSLKEVWKGKPNLEVRDAKGWTALAHAAWYGRTLDAAQKLVEAGARIEPLEWTPLHAAALIRDADDVQRLLSAGADPNARDRFGRTPLMWAARYIAFETRTIPALIAAGADPNAPDLDGATALHLAAQGAWERELAALLNGGAAIDARDHEGRTPLMRAAAQTSGNFKVAYLLKRGADKNAADHQGRTALMHAALNEWAGSGTLEVLLKAGADPCVRDASGKRAEDYVRENRNLYWVNESLADLREHPCP